MKCNVDGAIITLEYRIWNGEEYAPDLSWDLLDDGANCHDADGNTLFTWQEYANELEYLMACARKINRAFGSTRYKAFVFTYPYEYGYRGGVKMKYAGVQEMLNKHEMWLNGKEKGERATLRYCCGGYFYGLELTVGRARFLRDADFGEAKYTHCDFRRCDMEAHPEWHEGKSTYNDYPSYKSIRLKGSV